MILALIGTVIIIGAILYYRTKYNKGRLLEDDKNAKEIKERQMDNIQNDVNASQDSILIRKEIFKNLKF